MPKKVYVQQRLYERHDGPSHRGSFDKMKTKPGSRKQITGSEMPFFRQRYWGEPFPIYYENNTARPCRNRTCPCAAPNRFLPAFRYGRPPLASAKDWTYKGFPLKRVPCPVLPEVLLLFAVYGSPKHRSTRFGKQIPIGKT